MTSATACIVSPAKRAQFLVLPNLVTKKEKQKPPKEIAMRSNELLSVLVPGNATYEVVSQANERNVSLYALENARYRELSMEGGGTVPREILDFPLAGHRLKWLHFLAGEPTTAYLMLSSKNESGIVRIAVSPTEIVARGRQQTVSDSDQDTAILFGQFDSLQLDLPGTATDGWRATLSSGSIEVSAIANVVSDTHRLTDRSSVARVRLQLKLNPKQGEEILEVRSEHKLYRFLIRLMPTPTC